VRKSNTGLTRFVVNFPLPVMLPLYCGVTDMGGAVGMLFVETGIVVSGSVDPVVMGAVGSLVGVGDADDAGVGGSLVTVGDETPVGVRGLLVEVDAESVGLLVGVGAVDWATGSWFVDAVPGVSACWLHPYSNKLASILAAAIWIFCIDFIFVIPLFTRAFWNSRSYGTLRLRREIWCAT
jgi:hypothetical protein